MVEGVPRPQGQKAGTPASPWRPHPRPPDGERVRPLRSDCVQVQNAPTEVTACLKTQGQGDDAGSSHEMEPVSSSECSPTFLPGHSLAA